MSTRNKEKKSHFQDVRYGFSVITKAILFWFAFSLLMCGGGFAAFQ